MEIFHSQLIYLSCLIILIAQTLSYFFRCLSIQITTFMIKMSRKMNRSIFTSKKIFLDVKKKNVLEEKRETNHLHT